MIVHFTCSCRMVVEVASSRAGNWTQLEPHEHPGLPRVAWWFYVASRERRSRGVDPERVPMIADFHDLLRRQECGDERCSTNAARVQRSREQRGWTSRHQSVDP